MSPVIPGDPPDATSNRRGNVSRILQRITRTNWEVIGRQLLGTVCVFILGGMLVAGLWPFHSPKNHARWIAGSNGLYFDGRGTILSAGEFKPADAREDASCSLEVWIEPDFTAGSGTLLAFHAPGSPHQFLLDQSTSDLGLQTDILGERYRTRATRVYVGNIFRGGKPLFITVTANKIETSVYIDGALAKTFPKFPLSIQNFEGQLIIATAPVVDDTWSGILRGLAFYRQDLVPAQVYRHFWTWTTKGRPEVSDNERPVALYLFDEHGGRVIHNQVSSGIDLYIPNRYVVVDQAFLRPFWKEFNPKWGYWMDVLVNIGGFIPFGFIFCAYFSLARRLKRPALVTILLGFVVSLTIEVLQAYLPTRGSGTTDLITNTLGTCCGVWLYRIKLGRILIANTWANLVAIAEKM